MHNAIKTKKNKHRLKIYANSNEHNKKSWAVYFNIFLMKIPAMFKFCEIKLILLY